MSPSGDAADRLPTDQTTEPAADPQLLTAYTAGELVNDIAARFGVSRTTVIGHVTRRGLPRRSDGRSATDLRAAANLYADGHSLATVGQQFDVNPMTVANRFRQAGLPVRPRRAWA